MPPPAVGATTARLYAALPAYIRDADADPAQTGYPAGWPLLRFLSLLFDQASELEVLLDRFAHLEPSPDDPGLMRAASDLVDPAGADAAWLDWLGQVVGVDRADRDDATMRAAIAGAGTRARGSAVDLEAIVGPLLTGTAYFELEPHYLGDIWTARIVTLVTETPITAAELLAAVEPARAAGMTFAHFAGVTWAATQAATPTWADLAAAGGTWAAMYAAAAP